MTIRVSVDAIIKGMIATTIVLFLLASLWLFVGSDVMDSRMDQYMDTAITVDYPDFEDYLDAGRVDTVVRPHVDGRMYFYMDEAKDVLYRTGDPGFLILHYEIIEKGADAITYDIWLKELFKKGGYANTHLGFDHRLYFWSQSTGLDISLYTVPFSLLLCVYLFIWLAARDH